jgi:hypothetical protein
LTVVRFAIFATAYKIEEQGKTVTGPLEHPGRSEPDHSQPRRIEMGDKGSKDKAGREDKKKAKHSLKEKRKLKQEKKLNINVTTI